MFFVQKEIKNIFREYKKEITKMQEELASVEELMNNVTDMAEMMDYMEKYGEMQEAINGVKISDYSLSNEEEFFAEAFTQNEIGIMKSKYTERVMGVVNKYFTW